MAGDNKCQSARRTDKNSSVIHRWDRGPVSNVSPRSARLNPFCCGYRKIALRASVVRYADSPTFLEFGPSTEVPGYFQPSASRILLHGQPAASRTLHAGLGRLVFLISILLGSCFPGFSQ